MPMTIDGKTVLLNRHYYVRRRNHFDKVVVGEVLITQISVDADGFWANDDLGGVYKPEDDLFSTRDAAKQAGDVKD